ncbi:MAG: PF20097 family protein [Erysipelotrichales bacterium]|nr:PF20097 family protein [Erysipelotrichales bacterium]
MKIDKCPYCYGTLKVGKLMYRYAYRSPKIIFEDGSEKKISTFNPFKGAVINKVFYCESCHIMLADLDSDS